MQKTKESSPNIWGQGVALGEKMCVGSTFEKTLRLGKIEGGRRRG